MKAVSIFPKPALCQRFIFFIFGSILFLVMTGSAVAQTSLPGYMPPAAKPTPELPLSEKVRQGKAPQSRTATQVKLESVRLHRLPAPGERELRPERKSTRLRIGAVRQLNQPLSVAKDGTVFQVPEGKLFLLRVATAGAAMARLHFNQVALPPGARLFVYSRANPDESHPLHLPGENGLNVVGEREFWTPPMSGEEIVVEYLAADNGAEDVTALPFVIDQVSHIFLDPRSTEQNGAAACNLNVPAEWSEAATSVGLLQFATIKGEFACSGVLLNTSRSDNQPLFLTANHCLSESVTARNVTVNWLYTSGDQPGNGSPRTQGGAVIATGSAGDFSLMQLNFIPPGIRQAGWSAEHVAAGIPITSVHHPKFSYQRFAQGQTLQGNCPRGLPGVCEHFLPVRWQQGITEPGSSGGPLFAGTPNDPRVVGTLSGGLSSCNNPQGEDYFSRFEVAFPAIAPYLTGQDCRWFLQSSGPLNYGFETKTEELFSAAGGDGKIKLRANSSRECAWTARSETDWITLTSATTGVGETLVTYSVAPYTGSSSRHGTLLIAGNRLLVSQMGVTNCPITATTEIGQTTSGALTNSDCRSALDTGSFVDRYTLNVQAGQQVSLVLTSFAFDTFLLLYGPDGKLIAFNDDSNFTLTLNSALFFEAVADGTYTIEVSSFYSNVTGDYQLVVERRCPLSFAQEPALLPAAGGNGRLNVKAPPGCPWAAQAIATDWLTLTTSSGSGPGAIAFIAMANPTVAFDANAFPRVAQLNIISSGGPSSDTYREYVSQNYGCGFRVFPTGLTIKAQDIIYGAPARDAIVLNTGNNCSWTATSNAPWMEFYEIGPTYSGMRGRALSLSFNSIKLGNTPRSGTVTVAGQTVTVMQESIGTLCPIGELSVGQTLVDSLLPNCRSINGVAGYVKQYKFRGRTGQRVAITLNSIETFPRIWVRRMLGDDELALTFREDRDYGELLEGKTLRVPGMGFMTLPADGTYLIDIARGTYSPAEAGTFVISLTDADAVPCDLALSSNRASVFGSGGRGSINVSGACAWTAVTASPWIKIASLANGKVEYTVDPNPGAYRTGAISVGGQNLLITQTPANAPISVVSAADYQPVLTIGGIHALFGNGLATQTLVAATQPLPTTLDGTQIVLTDESGRDYSAQLFFISPSQINFRVELNVPPGPMTLTVKRNGQAVASTRFVLNHIAPGLFTADGSGRGVPAAYLLRIRPDNSRIEEPIYERDATGRITPRSIRLTDDEVVYLILYGTGFYVPYPGVAETEATFQSASAQTIQKGVAVAAPGFAGLDQVNLLLPRSLRGQGDVTLTIKRGGAGTNPVTIRIAP